jgi:ABC-type uncharacterized transport system substrate-binding protein
MGPELSAKRVEIVRTTFPQISALAVFLNPANSAVDAYWRTTEQAARSFGLRVARLEAESAEALRALRPTVFAGSRAVAVIPDPIFWNRRRDIVALVNTARLPAIYRRWRPDGVRGKSAGQFPPRGRLCRPHPEGS